MSDITKEQLKKEIAAILKDADLASTSSKKVRQEIAEKLNIDLSSRRKEIDELVMDYIEQDKSKANKKNGNVEEDEEDEEEENDSEEDEEEEDEEEKKPKRTNSKKAAPPAKRSKTASSEESEDASDDEGDDEYSPKKKLPKKGASKRGVAGAAGRKKKGGSDDDSDEDWGKGKKKRSAAATKKAPGAKRGGGGGYTKPVNLSPELAALVGEDVMPRHEVVKRVWAIIKERNLYDPKNKQFAICDDELLKIFGVKRFRTFGMMKFLKNHFRGD